MDRRNFLKIGAFTPFVNLVKATEKNDTTDIRKNKVEEKESAYPDIEKEVPLLLQSYARKFSSWPEMLLDQKEITKEYLNSKRYSEIKFEQYKNYFPKKTETEITELVNSVIQKRLKKINEAKVEYKKNKSFFKPNSDDYGGYNKGILTVDTTRMVPGKVAKEDFYNEKVEMFTFVHEYLHATQFPGLMSAPTLIEILNLLAKSNSVDKDYFAELAKEENRDDLDIDDSGLVGFEEYDSRYLETPPELVSFFGEIITMLHVISNTNNQIVKFDMTKDNFTTEHLQFLKDKKEEIFIIYKSKDGTVQKNLFDELLRIFNDDGFIQMMNRCF